MDRNFSLDGQWTLFYANEENVPPSSPKELECLRLPCIPAEVPGNVELDLSRAGLLPADLYRGMNPCLAEAYEAYGWWYRTEFDTPPAEPGERLFLRFEGVDCLAEYTLNDQLLGTSENAFIPHEFDVTEKIVPGGRNILWVHIRSALLEQLRQPYTQYLLCGWHSGGGISLRKPAHAFGWDIFPRALTAGLWKSVRLVARTAYSFEELGYFTRFSPGMEPHLQFFFSASAPMERLLSGEMSVRITGRCGEDSSFAAVYPLRKQKAARVDCSVRNPKLWWPFGYGEPNVYDAVAELLDGGAVVARKELTVGLRSLRLKRTESLDAERPCFQFEINGEDIMCRGSNWVPLNPYHSLDRERYPQALALASDIGCNMLRVWGGGVYEQEEFYDYCDRRGIMVWQDFMMACQTCPLDETLLSNMETEFTHVIRTLRHHPSIVLWAGDNEIDEALNSGGIDPSANRITRELIPRLLVQHDPFRPYLPSSPYISSKNFAALQQGKDLLPERHLWGARDYYKADFYTQSQACFVSETGYHGCPCPESVRQIVDGDCVWPWDNEQWTLHSSDQHGNDSRVRLMADQIRQLFAFEPETLEEFSLASQISQAEAKKYFIERIRAGRPKKSGILWWNLLDGWPQMSDAVVDYFFRKKLAYSYIKRAQAPFSLLIDEMRDWHYTLLAANDTLLPVTGSCRVSDIETGQLYWEGSFTAAPNRTTPIARIRMLYSEQRMLLLQWSAGGQTGFNHYLCGMPPFSLEKYRDWLEKLRALEENLQ
ncbi:MAG: glycoside hydrolase family 2 protein [Candidatus Merdivicinus sp.]